MNIELTEDCVLISPIVGFTNRGKVLAAANNPHGVKAGDTVIYQDTSPLTDVMLLDGEVARIFYSHCILAILRPVQ